MENTNNFFYNPYTKRMIKKGTQSHKGLLRKIEFDKINSSNDIPTVEAVEMKIYNHQLSVEASQALKALNQRDKNLLIRKLLYERLMSIPIKNKPGRPCKPISITAKPIVIENKKIKKKKSDISDSTDSTDSTDYKSDTDTSDN